MMRDLDQCLLLAQAGDEDAMMSLIGQYMPLILNTSRINGVFDEDCYQYILSKLIPAIRKF